MKATLQERSVLLLANSSNSIIIRRPEPTPARSSAVAAALLLSVCFLANSAPAQPGNRNPGVLPVNATPLGKSYGEWSGAWWRWTYSIPADSNPVVDPTGEFAGVGQSGHVWFLAGNFGGTTVRTATVPVGKALVLPILNAIWINTPELGDNPWSDEQRDFARSVIAPFVDNAFDLSCTVDGVAVADIESYRARTPDGGEYFVTVPEDNITGGFLGAGTYGPCVDDGIYLILVPLRAGQHTIRITSASEGSVFGDFELDVTYCLTVQ